MVQVAEPDAAIEGYTLPDADVLPCLALDDS